MKRFWIEYSDLCELCNKDCPRGIELQSKEMEKIDAQFYVCGDCLRDMLKELEQ